MGRMDVIRTLLTLALSTVIRVELVQSALCDRETQFQCASDKSCIALVDKCDYIDNCDDGSDEQGCSYPPVDRSRALVYATNDKAGQTSTLKQLFGNPRDYAFKLTDMKRHANSLDINYRILSIKKFRYFHRIAVDSQTGNVFYSNNHDGRLHFGKFLNGSKQDRFFIAPPITKQMNGVTFDWVSRNLYWTDGEYKLIGVTTTATRVGFWKPIVSSNLTSPQDLVVHPIQRLLFWSDGTGVQSKIERSNLKGNDRQVLVDMSQGLIAPTSLVIDFASDRLYWFDAAASKIGSVNFDGSMPVTWQNAQLGHGSCMTLLENFIFVGDSRESTVYIYGKQNVSAYISSISAGSTGPVTDMAIYWPDGQPRATSSCSVNNGGCSQFCFPTSSESRVCDCAVGFYTGDDGVSCETRRFAPTIDSLLVADEHQQTVYQLRPDTGELRSLFADNIRAVALDVDQARKLVYVVEKENVDGSGRHFIRRLSFDGGHVDQTIFTTADDRSRLVDISVDTRHGLLYYTDNGFGVVGEVSVASQRKRTIVNNTADKPTAVAIDTKTRRLYWSDCKASRPPTINSVLVADVTERPHVVFNATTTSSCITAIVLDVHNDVMYWAVTSEETSSIMTSSLDGKQHRILHSEERAKFTGMTLFNEFLYITDMTKRGIMKLNLADNEVSMQEPAVFSQLMAVVSYKSSLATQTPVAHSTTPTTTSTSIKSTPVVSVVSELPVTSARPLLPTFQYQNGTCELKLKSYSAHSGACSNGPNDGHVYINGRMVWEAGWCSSKANRRGVSTMLVDPVTCAVADMRRFDTWQGAESALDLVDYLHWIHDGAVVLGVTGDEPTRFLGHALRTLRSAGVSVDDVESRGSFVFVLQKGFPEKTQFAKSLTNSVPNSYLEASIIGSSDGLKITTVSKLPI